MQKKVHYKGSDGCVAKFTWREALVSLYRNLAILHNPLNP